MRCARALRRARREPVGSKSNLRGSTRWTLHEERGGMRSWSAVAARCTSPCLSSSACAEAPDENLGSSPTQRAHARRCVASSLTLQDSAESRSSGRTATTRRASASRESERGEKQLASKAPGETPAGAGQQVRRAPCVSVRAALAHGEALPSLDAGRERITDLPAPLLGARRPLSGVAIEAGATQRRGMAAMAL